MPSQLANTSQPDTISLKSGSKGVGSKVPSLSREDIVDCVAGIITDMIQDSKVYTQPSEIPKLSPFHAKKAPTISVKDYLKRFATHSNCHYDAFIYALIYLDRAGEMYENFTLDSFNVLRLILMSLVSAIKFYDDAYFKNSYYAKIGGVSPGEFNELEEIYLVKYVQFNLYVDVQTYSSYFDDLLNYHQARLVEHQQDSL
jgi:hypothetical protein